MNHNENDFKYKKFDVNYDLHFIPGFKRLRHLRNDCMTLINTIKHINEILKMKNSNDILKIENSIEFIEQISIYEKFIEEAEREYKKEWI